MDNINKNCFSDSDCENNFMCSFNDQDLNNYCIRNDVTDLYTGCLNNNVENNFEVIETKSNDKNFNYIDCINFSRKQTNKDNLEYNYMVFKPKKEAYVDTTTINIYLKCDSEILAVIPYNDYFTLKCDVKQENCVLESKESLFNFIKQNTRNCNGNLYLEINYLCENEGLRKDENIPISLNKFIPIKIDLKCPIDPSNDKFKAKCEALYIPNNGELYPGVDNGIGINDCRNPLFKVPRIVTDTQKYKKAKSKITNNELKDYDAKINEKIEDLKKLEAEKYMKVNKYKKGVDISLEESYEIINKKPFSNFFHNTNEKWKLFNNYDAAQNLFPENEKNTVLSYYGKVYTLNEAINAAEENDQNYFVWYHNSYELDDFASKLYFIDIYFGNQSLLKMSNWVKHENVTTGVSKIEVETFEDSYNIIEEEEEIHLLQEQIKASLTNLYDNAIIDTQWLSENINSNSQFISSYVINNLNSKITTYGQAIQMNEYETKLNDQILIGLYITLIIMILLFVAIMAYLNVKYAGKVKLMGK
jgi:hypothetical protein